MQIFKKIKNLKIGLQFLAEFLIKNLARMKKINKKMVAINVCLHGQDGLAAEPKSLARIRKHVH